MLTLQVFSNSPSSMTLEKLTQVLKTIKHNSGSTQTLDESIDALLETIGFESKEEREPEKELIHLLVASYRSGILAEQSWKTKRF